MIGRSDGDRRRVNRITGDKMAFGFRQTILLLLLLHKHATEMLLLFDFRELLAADKSQRAGAAA